MNYPPHITLAVYDDVDRTTLFKAYHRATEQYEALSIQFSAMRYFESPTSLIVWASPQVEDALLKTQAVIHEAINKELCRAHYRPNAWVPHCSLALNIPLSRRSDVLALLAEPFEPVTARFEVLDCVSFMPVQVLHQKTFL